MEYSSKNSKTQIISCAVVIAVLLLSTSTAFAAEGYSVPLKKTPVISSKTGGASKLSKSKVETGQKLSSKNSFNNKGNNPPKNEKSPFIKNLFNMLKALFAVLTLIGGLAGGILLYRRFKNTAIVQNVQQQITQPAQEIKEPETVSEAVASFVKHRIRK